MAVVTNWSVELTFGKTAGNANTTTGNGNSFFSVAFWIKNPTSGNFIVTKYDGGIPQGWLIFIDNIGSGNQVFFQVQYDDSSLLNMNSVGVVPDDNLWHHVVITYDDSGITGNIYIDGVLDTTNTQAATSTNYDNGQPIFLGETGGLVGTTLIDDVRFYQSELTPTNVANLFAGNEIPTGTRQAYWPIEAGSGSIIADASGNGNTLTFNTLPIWSTDTPVPPLMHSGPVTHTVTVSDTQTSSDNRISTVGKALTDIIILSEQVGFRRTVGPLDTVNLGEWIGIQKIPANVWTEY